MASLSHLSVIFFVLCDIQRLSASILLTANPSATVTKGTPVQIVCHVQSEIKPANTHCTVTWSRTYFPGREWRHDEPLEGGTLDQPRYYTTTDSNGRPIRSSVHIPQMKHLYRGNYQCKLTCGDHETTATLAMDLVTVPVTLGATVGTLMAFIVISVILLLAFFIGCRHCCASPAANQVALSRSSESLLRQQRESEEQLAPPRYSVVVSLQQDGEAIESMLREDTSERIGGVLMLQPPSYEDALRELAARGIILNTEKLKPMPPAYRDLPYTITSATADGPAVLELKTISSRVSSAEVV